MKKAVDIVLFPSPELMNISISMSRQAYTQEQATTTINDPAPTPRRGRGMNVKFSYDAASCGESTLVPTQSGLNTRDRIPHLSLLMGVLDDIRLPKIQIELQKIAARTSPLTLKITRTSPSWLVVERSDKLMTLHQTIIEKIDPFLTHNPSTEMFCEPAGHEVAPDVFPWLKDFIPQYSGQRFQPHITTFSQAAFPQPMPYTFLSDRLAICHLGDFNTCREILTEERLK